MRLLILAAAAAFTLTACTSTPTAAPATPPAPSKPAFDGSTLSACKHADAATVGSKGDYQQATKEAHFARDDAALSDVPALREVAKENTDPSQIGMPIDDVKAFTAAARIGTWCIEHHVGRT